MYKDLGILFVERFNFISHTESLATNASKSLVFLIRRTSLFQNNKAMIVLYNAFVRSQIEYGAILWATNKKLYIKLLEKIQKHFHMVISIFRVAGIESPGESKQFFLCRIITRKDKPLTKLNSFNQKLHN